ncbi:MAG: Transferase hexapeptide repeat containing protein [Candidatus Roizmanbacteria bacterium GW2011_GWA2_37_7]|uniref:Transferase hexapeptide repeat containing protein n=1 Tax=Candidatus Roizmanbacteria bacterium GW2011_GWA2_37_7 TaxID=1618481 RepID=A0A0G0H9K8_9BACT|nr:MAG: Transferase hexapeptide repeat containing protein [Candidatus Roizmanbacteria bacterium GW2011_GWA2_37_7]
MTYFKHPTSEISESAIIGNKTKIWHYVQIRDKVSIGSECIIGKNVYIDFEVHIGNRCKIQNNVSIFHGVTIEDGVFIGPHVCFSNDKFPRAINEDGALKTENDWALSKTLIKKGASIGANSTILPGITIGEYAMIGAGTVVTKDVPSFILVYGNPAKPYGRVNRAGKKI